MAFSGALQLTDLDDFLAPSQACILPVKQKNKVDKQSQGVNANTEIRIDDQNKYYEVAISKPSVTIELPGSTGIEKTRNGPPATSKATVGTQLEKAEISLNDCLACSGCVTSTESMLITLQSHLEVQNYISSHASTSAERDGRIGIMSLSPQTLASLVAAYNEVPSSSTTPLLNLRILSRRIRSFLSQPENGGWTGVWDTTLARHLSLLEHVKEYKERRLVGRAKQANNHKEGEVASLTGGGLPMLASACPGWVCYAEKAHGDLLDLVGTTRSAQAVMGALVKQWWADRHEKTPKEIYHVTVMPCYDKKLEASRSDFYSELFETRDVDCVLTTGELDLLLRERGFDPLRPVQGENDAEIPLSDSPFPELLTHPGTSSGSYLHTLIDSLARESRNNTRLTTRQIRGSEDHMEYILEDAISGEILFKGAKCYGFRNLQNLVRKVGKETGIKATGRSAGASKLSAAVAARRRAGKAKLAAESGVSSSASSIMEQAEDRPLDYVEVMACPGGCVNGGGQMKPKSENAATAKQVERDAEGYERNWREDGVEPVKPQVDEGMRWSTKEWVAKVEMIYWSGLPTPPPSPPATLENDSDGNLWQIRALSVDPKTEYADTLAKQIIASIACPSTIKTYIEDADPVAENRRREFLRTRYRKVESDISGLTQKW